MRFIDTPHGVLVNHHSWEIDSSEIGGMDSSTAQMAPLKSAIWDEEGTLRLMWWEGNERAKGRPLRIELDEAAGEVNPRFLKTTL